MAGSMVGKPQDRSRIDQDAWELSSSFSILKQLNLHFLTSHLSTLQVISQFLTHISTLLIMLGEILLPQISPHISLPSFPIHRAPPSPS